MRPTERQTRDPASWIEPGKNCWRRERAARASVLTSTEQYFRAFKEAAIRARHTISVLGWDIHGEIELERGVPRVTGWPNRLADLLSALAEARPDLRVRILSWDYPLVYAGERQKFQVAKLDWMTPDNVQLVLDDDHPIGASQHQKVVVVDDALAFVGGIDLSLKRWDSADHEPGDPRRVAPNGDHYPPFHDAQMICDGAAAAAAGELFRTRWQRSTGERVQLGGHVASESADLWPPSVEPGFHHVDVALARTWPHDDGRDVDREVEALWVDMIRSARRWIYLENQYVSSEHILSVLAERLREPEGPEVVLVAPKHYAGRVEERIYGPVRQRLVRALVAADRYGRFRAVYPSCSDEELERAVYVHAKVGLVDDRVVRVGSANLSDRSMGMDSECDAAILARTDEQREGVRRVLHRFLAMHLGLPAATVGERIDANGSLLAVIDDGSDGERCLARLPLYEALDDGETGEESFAPFEILFDPSSPLEKELGELWPLHEQKRRRWPWVVGGGVAIAVGAAVYSAWVAAREAAG